MRRRPNHHPARFSQQLPRHRAFEILEALRDLDGAEALELDEDVDRAPVLGQFGHQLLPRQPGGAARVAWSLTPEVDAMIVNSGANDMLRGLDPAQARDNIETILKVAETEDIRVLLVAMPAPGNYGRNYKQDFDALYPDLEQAYGTLFYDNFFKGLGSDDLAELRAYFQNDGIHPNADGVARIVEALGPSVAELVQASASVE